MVIPCSNKPIDNPAVIKEVNFINGGSEVCGLTFSAAKDNRVRPFTRPSSKPVSITFDDSDLEDVAAGHHDSLVIKIQVGTSNVGRVLVDGGSSVNIIMIDTLRKMGIKDDQVITKSNVLVGFSGEIKHTIGKIELPTYADGVVGVSVLHSLRVTY